MTSNEQLEQKQLRHKSRTLFKTLMNRIGFKQIKNSRDFWFKELSPYFQCVAQFPRTWEIEFYAGYQVVLPWTIFNNILTSKAIERVRALWNLENNEPFHAGSILGIDHSICLSFQSCYPQNSEEYDDLEQRCISFFEVEVVPFFERYQTIYEYFKAFESGELSLSALGTDSFRIEPLGVVHMVSGCYYLLIKEQREALNQFQLARNIYLNGVSSSRLYAPTLDILSIFINHLNEGK